MSDQENRAAWFVLKALWVMCVLLTAFSIGSSLGWIEQPKSVREELMGSP